MGDPLDLDTDSIIAEILSDDVPTPEPFHPPRRNPVSQSPPSPRISSSHSAVSQGICLKKCMDVYVGGTNVEVGMTTSPLHPCTCSNIACIKCDHPVLRFENSQWSEDADYLFFRLNYPHTLSSKLQRSPGMCAYCCQCTSCSEREPRRLNTYSSAWVCRGHAK